jgi:hypothetical protein
MSKQTAVEWLFDKLLEEGPSGELRWHLKYDIFKILEQAKAMEKEQIILANEDCSTNELGEFISGEQFYEETYKK